MRTKLKPQPQALRVARIVLLGSEAASRPPAVGSPYSPLEMFLRKMNGKSDHKVFCAKGDDLADFEVVVVVVGVVWWWSAPIPAPT